MKSIPESERPFDETLADFELAPLPSEWKSELIENAVLEASDRKNPKVSPIKKIAIGTLAACWVAIAALQFTTPSPTEFANTGISEPTELSPDKLPTIAARFVRLNSYEQTPKTPITNEK